MIEPATEAGCSTYYTVKHRLLSAYAAKWEAKASRLPTGTMEWAIAMVKVTEAHWAIGRLKNTLRPTRN